MRDVVRLGIIGAGSIALRGYFPHLTMADVRDRVRITAVCDPVLERAQAAAARFGVPAAYATHRGTAGGGRCRCCLDLFADRCPL